MMGFSVSDLWKDYTPAGKLYTYVKGETEGKSATDLWKDYTPAGKLYEKYIEPTTDKVWNNATETVETVKETVSNGANLVKKYWYIPVAVGGALLGLKILGTVNTARLISALKN